MERNKAASIGDMGSFSFQLSKHLTAGEGGAMTAEQSILVLPSYEPLNKCLLYAPHTKPARHKLNEKYWKAIDPRRFIMPVCERIFREESICMHHKILMGSKSNIDLIASAIRKIYAGSELLNAI